ncbi:MAG: hypothetical protein ACM3N5_07655 [Candidatus Eiseniibacteriota bacterium]
MTNYRCYCVGRDGHIRNVNVIACESDRDARARGAELLDACYHDAVEIWDGARRVGQVTKTRRQVATHGDAAANSCCGSCAS